jgi:hypothetical protein
MRGAQGGSGEGGSGIGGVQLRWRDLRECESGADRNGRWQTYDPLRLGRCGIAKVAVFRLRETMTASGILLALFNRPVP